GRALIVTDKVLCENGVVEKVLQELKNENLDYVLYNDVNQNPTTKNVNDGLDIYKKNNCNYIISIGGGSPQDTAKAIGILVTNGGNIVDYEGIFKSKNKSVP
ncbi:MAG: iron-containing alcohol dehydrogenase, partial [Acinetobacter sp.]